MSNEGQTPTPSPMRSPVRLEHRVAFESIRQRLFTESTDAVTFGRFVILERVGAGGMGIVYAARDPRTDRKVALKVLHSSLASGQGRARLRREARAAAALAHPNVVTVYESGVAEGDVTFVAMEFVTGPTLRQWFEAQSRPWRSVVEMMLAAGDGLVAAHAAGLMHRDFKPDNVLIGPDGRPRVADFGLALGAEDVERERVPTPHDSVEAFVSLSERLTRTGAVAGTPAYMPLEQMERNGADARSDQFAFCVTLYEGLYGERPFAGPTSVALRVALESGELRPPPRGTRVPTALREVVARGLATDREDRWPSMDVLLAELRRLVARRSRYGWALALGLAGGLVALGVGIGTRAPRVEPCGDASSQHDGIWDGDRRQAVEAAILSTRVPYAAATWTRVEQRLDDYTHAWETQHTRICEATNVLGEQPPRVMDLRMQCMRGARVALRESVEVLASADETSVEGAVTLVAGLPDLSRCDDVGALQAVASPAEDPLQAERVAQLEGRLERARSLHWAGNHEQSLAVTREVTEQAQQLDHAPLLARAMLQEGMSYSSMGRYEAAEEALERAYLLATEIGDDAVKARAAVALIVVLSDGSARYEQARQWGKAALALTAQPTVEREIEVRALISIGDVLTSQGELPDALVHHRRALALAEQALGPMHPTVAIALRNVGDTLVYQKTAYEEALEYHRRALAIEEAVQGPEHPRVALALNGIGQVYVRQGKYEEALEYHRRALAIQEKVLGPRSLTTASTLNSAGVALMQLGKGDEALEYFQRALSIEEDTLGPEHLRVAATRRHIGGVLMDQARFVVGLEQYRRALSITERLTSPDHPQLGEALGGVGKALYSLGQYEAAIEYFQRSLAIAEKTLGPRHPNVGWALYHLAVAVDEGGNLEGARPLYERALSIEEESLGPDHPNLAYLLNALALVGLETRDYAAGRAHAERALSIIASSSDKFLLPTLCFTLAKLLWPDRRERRRAVELAEQARAIFAERGGAYMANVEIVDAWMRKVGARPRAAP